MERVAEIISSRAKGRQIVVYGCGDAGSMMCRLLSNEMVFNVSFFVDKNHFSYNNVFAGLPVFDNTILNASKHFVIIAPLNPLAKTSIMNDLQKQCGFESQDWFHWDDDVDFDVVLKNGICIGKHTGMVDVFLQPSAPLFLNYVGKFTSINSSLEISFDHYVGISTHRFLNNGEMAEIHKINIGNDVWIGANVFINASKVESIGDGAIIGTGAVVVDDVPPYAIMVGVPAKIKKYRFTPDRIGILQRIQWWNWSKEKIEEHKECFTNTDLFFKRFSI